LKVGTADLAPTTVSDERFMDVLSGLGHSQARTMAPCLVHLRSASSIETSLVFVSGPPPPSELPTLLRATTGYGPRLAILIYPTDPRTLPPDQQSQLEGRATQARLGLTRAGWDCIVLSPTMRLAERWHVARERPLAYSG
jgi:hypothetical protein